MALSVRIANLALAALALSLSACSGDDETPTGGDAAATGGGATGGSGPNGGSSGGGSSSAGSSSAGSSSAGSSNGGTSNGGTSNGGTSSAGTSSGGASSGAGGAGGASPSGGSGGTGALPPGDPTCPPGAVFCESFEGAENPNLERWDIEPPWGQEQPAYLDYFTIETTSAADGVQSAHFRYGEEFGVRGAWAFLQTKAAIPAPNDRVYARFYLRFADLALSPSHPFYVSVFDARGQWDTFLGSDPMPTLGFGSIRGEFNVGVLGNGLDNAQIWTGGAQTLRENEWFCVEMMVFGDGQGSGDTQHDAEEARVWVNGTEISALLANDARWSGEAERWSPLYDGARWRLGFTSIPSQREEYWLDAFVIAHERIGCLP